MTRLFLPHPIIEKEIIALSSEHATHLRVLRKNVGDNITIFNEGGEWLAHIHSISKKRTEVTVTQKTKEARAVPFRALYFGLCRKKTTDFILEKGTELGVTHFYPFFSEYSQRYDLNERRCQDIIISAMEQCERLDKPVFHPLQGFKDIISCPVSHSIYAFVERNGSLALADLMGTQESALEAVMVGAEGGFSAEEKSQMERFSHIIHVGLGDTILRAETAVIAALSLSLVKELI